jgi:hypothetical protein
MLATAVLWGRLFGREFLADRDEENVALGGIPFPDDGQVLHKRLELAGRHGKVFLDRLATLLPAIKRLDPGFLLDRFTVHDLNRGRLGRQFAKCVLPSHTFLVQSLLRWRLLVEGNLTDTD